MNRFLNNDISDLQQDIFSFLKLLMLSSSSHNSISLSTVLLKLNICLQKKDMAFIVSILPWGMA